jgi:hypothetical protein
VIDAITLGYQGIDDGHQAARARMERPLKLVCCVLAVTAVLAVSGSQPCFASEPSHASPEGASFPRALESYDDADQGVVERLTHRVESKPFNLVATLLFLLAISHTFLSSKFLSLSHQLEHAHNKKIEAGTAPLRSVSQMSRLLHFLGEVEVIFGLWAIPLLLSIVFFFDWPTLVGYVSHTVNYTEAMFVVVIMTLASTRPILRLSEGAMKQIAQLFGGSLTAWWLTILTIGPILGSFITEPAAMTICALLLKRKFYRLGPSLRLKFGTVGLLFVNVSVGGTLTHFAAPPVLMVAGPWGWDMAHMLSQFGWKAVVGILASNLVYWLLFRKELESLREKFTVLSLKDEILRTHLPREAIERAIDKVVADIRAETGDIWDDLSAQIERFVAEVRERLERQLLTSIAKSGVDPELAAKAFESRFEEIKLYRLRRAIPQLLPEGKRPAFQDPNWDQREDPVPLWVVLVHVAFMGWTIVNAHHPALFIPGMLFFLGFAAVTADYQNRIDLKSPMLVGFFLAGLVTHGGVQGWWIEPVLGGLAPLSLAVVATVLTAFNDNAAITYLSTLVPGFTEGLKYAVVAGAVSGGGLTVIANAPNPAGQALLKDHFENGVTPAGLLKAALIPTVILFLCFMILP